MINQKARADAIVLLASCEKHLRKWNRTLAEARDTGDTETAEVARQVCDRLLDLRSVLTERLASISA